MERRIVLVALLPVLFVGVSPCRKTMINGHGVTEGDKNVILDYHNRLRQAVAAGQIPGQPPAANMMEMKWDFELAQRAQKWSISCASKGHDGGRHSSRFHVGQNIARMWTRKPPSNVFDMMANFKDAISGWFNEHKLYRYSATSTSPSTAHYTQLVWAQTNLVGCGFSYYFDQEHGFTKKYVCNYGASGNILGELPYAKGGPSCRRFDLVPSGRYAGLCDKASRYHDLYSNHIG